MFKLKAHYTNIRQFCISEKNIFWCDENNNLYWNHHLVQQNVDSSAIVVIGDHCYYLDAVTAKSYCLDLKSKQIQAISHHIWMHTFYKNRFVHCEYLFEFESFKIGVCDFNTKTSLSFESHYDIWNLIQDQNAIYYFNTTKKIVKKVSLTIGDFEWQTALDIERVIKIVGIFEDRLIITYETAQNQTGAAALDTHTGTILWQQLIQGLDTFYAVGTPKNTLINLKSGGLWHNGIQRVKGRNLFAEIDLQTGIVLREGILQALDEVDLQVRTFEIKAPYIYFTANHQGSFGAIALGVLSLQTLKLLWWEVVKMEQADGFGNFLLNSITVLGNQLGILDKTGVLHLYEKQVGFRPKRTHQKGLAPFEEVSVESHESKSTPQTATIEQKDFSTVDITAAPTQATDDLPF